MKKILFLILFVSHLCSAQENLLQPFPKVLLKDSGSQIYFSNLEVGVNNDESVEKKAAEYFKHLVQTKFNLKITDAGEIGKGGLVSFDKIEPSERLPNDQYYLIKVYEKDRLIKIESASQPGLIYGAVTLTDLIYKEEEYFKVDFRKIEDWPAYQGRLFVADPSPDDIPSLFDWALRNKLETVVIASRQHPWFEISEEYAALLKKIKQWRDKYGAPEVMQSHNIYEGRDIVISDINDVNALKNVIKVSYEHGMKKLMILSDDTPPYKFGEGYILTNENDKIEFEHFEAANTYLMNKLVEWFDLENMDIEPYYVPAFYTYEEMHQGDMSLFLNTPWEKDAFDPFYRDLKYIGTNMDESVYLIWCGPNVRSRKITKNDFEDWKKNLQGRAPFLWDNTIYSHYPFTSTSMLTAWDNELPDEFDKITAGNGMFINNDANSETGIVGTITTNDYLWDPKSYDPRNSLETAVSREYGSGVKDLILEFKDVELNIRRVIGERKLWFEADSLWSQIRHVRRITEKNPFYYHLNYSRMKTLRLQLKASVPEPDPKNDFIEKTKSLFNKRTEILSEIKIKDESAFGRIKDMAVQMPDFEQIK